MDELQKDPRYQELQKDYQQENELTKDVFSQVGFGRSTNTIASLEKVGEAHQIRVSNLASIVTVENTIQQMIAQGVTGKALEGLYNQLGNLQNQGVQLATQAQGRRQGILKTADELVGQAYKNLKRIAVPRGIRVSARTSQMGGTRQSNVQGPQNQTAKIFTPQKNISSLISPGKKMFSKSLTPHRKIFHL